MDCWPLPCPPVDCEFTVVPEGECCPRCVTDPCQADTIRNDITKTCTDEHGISRFSGSSWIKHGTECTLCQCKVSFSLNTHRPGQDSGNIDPVFPPFFVRSVDYILKMVLEWICGYLPQHRVRFLANLS